MNGIIAGLSLGLMFCISAISQEEIGFVEGTGVLMKNLEIKRIEQVVVGDEVFAYSRSGIGPKKMSGRVMEIIKYKVPLKSLIELEAIPMGPGKPLGYTVPKIYCAKKTPIIVNTMDIGGNFVTEYADALKGGGWCQEVLEIKNDGRMYFNYIEQCKKKEVSGGGEIEIYHLRTSSRSYIVGSRQSFLQVDAK